MAAAEGPKWGEIASQVAQGFGLNTNRSPAITSAIEKGVRFIRVDNKAGELVFDMRALFLGFLAAGQQDRESINFGNTASWFAAWLSTRLGADQIAVALSPEGMTDPEDVFESLGDGGFDVVLSHSVRKLLEDAQSISNRTNRPSEFEARHLFSAMIESGAVAMEIQRAFNVTLPDSEFEALKVELIARINAQPAPGETEALWRAALNIADGTPPPPPPAPDGVSGFSRDSVAAAGPDLLRTGRDAEALARLVCLDQAAPLAIAIFGDWGSGKSTFMSRLDEAVKEIARAQREDPPEDADPATPSAKFISRVVQIRFNAWQFVDANLWASLTSEFFDQLRAGGWDRASGVRHAGLVERVNRHVHSLNTEVEARREAAAAIGKDVLKAQQAVDEAARAATKASAVALGRAAVDLLGDAYESQKANLSALGLKVAGIDSAKAVDAIVIAAASGRSTGHQAVAVLRVVAKSPLRITLVLVSLLVLAEAVWWAYWSGLTSADLRPALVALGAIGTAAVAMTPALKVVAEIARRSADIAHAVHAADRDSLKTLLGKEVALRETTAEAEALQGAATRAAKRLSRYVSADGSPNPPRLLRYVLEDDPDTKALQSEIGLIGRTRRLFQAVDDIVRTEKAKPVGERLDGDTPDRIVLYIDDLDRCTDEQVYNVLQAIHLLLAFDLFVVVVGVDVKRVQGALARALKPREADQHDDAVAQLAASYLEKIFQIAFWLAPLSANDPDGGSYARYVRGLAGDLPALPRDDEGSPPARTTPDAALAAKPTDARTTDETTVADTETAKRAAVVRRRKALATINLTKAEVDFLASKEIAAVAARTPRAVKRLMNVYRLVRTRLSDEGVSILGDGKTPPAYPLIALMVAIETGQPVGVADDFDQTLRALNPLAQLHQPGAWPLASQDQAAKAAVDFYKGTPAILDAVKAAANLRGGELDTGEVLAVALLARRYSFNTSR